MFEVLAKNPTDLRLGLLQKCYSNIAMMYLKAGFLGIQTETKHLYTFWYPPRLKPAGLQLSFLLGNTAEDMNRYFYPNSATLND